MLKINGLQQSPRFLWFLTLLFGITIIFAHWFKAKQVSIFNLNTDAGILVFTFTFFLISIITEAYGYKCARQAIWIGFFFYLFMLIYGQLSTYLPGPMYAIEHNALVDAMHTLSIRTIFATLMSYLLAEFLNAQMIARLKVLFKGRHIALRFIAATFTSATIYGIAFFFLAFALSSEYENFSTLALHGYLLQLFILFIGLFLLLPLVRRIKYAEKIDMYDIDTYYTVFRLEAKYSGRENRFGTS